MLDSLTPVHNTHQGGHALWKYARPIQPRSTMDHSTPEMQAASGEKLLTASELEAWLEIDRKTVYTYAQKGLIPYIKIQSNLRFRRSEILEWLESHSYRPNKMRKRKKQ